MTHRVRLFARARDLAGLAELSLDLPAGSTVADLRGELARICPPLSSLLPRCVFAVGDEFAGETVVLAEGVEIALLPPVSGG